MSRSDQRTAPVILFAVSVSGALFHQAATAAGETQAREPEVSCEEAQPSETVSVDTKGVEFGPWLRRFVNQVRRHMRVPAEHETTVGCAVVSFKVNRDGTISDVAFKNASSTPALSETSRLALVEASPVEQLPAGYPDEFIAVTSTFYYNMSPRQSPTVVAIPTP